MQQRIINPWTWQDAFGFVQAQKITDARHILFTAGIVATDPDGNLQHGGNMERQMDLVADNLETVLGQAGFTLSDIVRLTYFTTDIAGFGRSSQVFLDRLRNGGCRPATSLIGVESLFHPDCVIEIEATAMK